MAAQQSCEFCKNPQNFGSFARGHAHSHCNDIASLFLFLQKDKQVKPACLPACCQVLSLADMSVPKAGLSNFIHVVSATLPLLGLHAGSRKFNAQNEE
jgi:hypothetical protein